MLVKICGITNVEDAIQAMESGADMLGFVFAESPRRVDVVTVKHIQRVLCGDIRTVGVFTDESDDILGIMEDCSLTYAQLHGNHSDEFARRIGADRVVRAARIRDEGSISELSRFEAAAFYLLDAYVPGLAGGTGVTLDWQLALKAKELGKPIILAGGLEPGNVAEAVRMVRPYGVDASSKLEASPGKKDHIKVKEFIHNVREADAS